MSTPLRAADGHRVAPDALRPPAPGDPTAPAYKDWLHVNVFDHATGTVGLVNLSLHGAPADPRARAVGAALFDVPGLGWAGNLVVRDLAEASLGTASVGLDRIGLGVAHTAGVLEAGADLPGDRLSLRLSARTEAAELRVERPLPLGQGWISWYVLPRLAATGTLQVAGTRLAFDTASAYHDHNWGRWHWGDDFGWDWGSFHAPDPGPTVVLARTTDRLRRRPGPLLLAVATPDAGRRFTGPAVRLREEAVLDVAPRRVPGATAVLRSDRARPRLPARTVVVADDGVDHVELCFTARSATQLVLADPVRPGHSFVHESTGAFTLTGRLGGVDLEASGLGVLERVD